MQKKLLTKIIKSNSKNNKSVEKLIDEFVKTQSGAAKNHLEDFLSDMLVYVNKNFDGIDKESLLSISKSKLKDLNISFDTKEVDTIYTKLAATETVGGAAKFVFNEVDLKAIESMRDSFQWVGKEYNSKTQDKLKGVIESAFKGDSTRESISGTLKKEFEDIIEADVRYFEGVADHVINQTQNISKVNQALKYDVKHFKVSARIDVETSDICLSMHGKIIEAAHLSQQVNDIVGAKSIGEKKAAATWSSKPVYGKLDKNFGLPPYHFKCRTEVVPVWLSEETIDGKKVKYASKKKDDIITHIDKTGVQRRVDKRIHDKLKNKHGLKDGDIIGALNSIKEIAPHKNQHGRTSAITQNGYYISFAADKVVTMYPPSKNTKKYFKSNAIENKKEIIKWDQESLLLNLMSTIGK